MIHAVRRSAGFFLLMLCIGLDMAVAGPTLPALAGQTGSSLGVVGLLFLVGAGAATLGTVLGSWIFDTTGGRSVLGIAQLCSSVLIFLVPHAPRFGVLVLLFFFKGIAGGLINTGCNTLLMWTHGEKSAPFINALHFFFGLGAFLSPFLLGLLLEAGGTYAEAYHLLGLMEAIPGGLILAFLRPPAAPVARDPQGADKGHGKAHSSVALLVICAALYLFFYVGAELTFGGWVSTYALTLRLADTMGAAFVASLFWLSFTCGRLASIPIAIRVPPRITIPLAMSGSALFLALLVFVPASSQVLWITAAGIGLFMAPLWPSGYTLAGRSLKLTARLSGLILLGDSFGGMVLPGLTGLIMERAGAPAMGRLVLGSLAAAFLGYVGIRLFSRTAR